jgi:arylsulfatase
MYKHWVHEGGISTPMIACWPNGAVAGGISHAPAHIIDFMDTFLDAAGVTYPEEHKGRAIQPLEGESLLPALRGEPWQRQRPILWEHEGNRAVRDGRWKLVRKYPGAWELYDMVEDRTELNDLAEKNRSQVTKMAAMYAEWAERCGVLPWEETLARMRGK